MQLAVRSLSAQFLPPLLLSFFLFLSFILSLSLSLSPCVLLLFSFVHAPSGPGRGRADSDAAPPAAASQPVSSSWRQQPAALPLPFPSSSPPLFRLCSWTSRQRVESSSRSCAARFDNFSTQLSTYISQRLTPSSDIDGLPMPAAVQLHAEHTDLDLKATNCGPERCGRCGDQGR